MKRKAVFIEPEIPYAGEVPLTPNVRPVIVLKGSDYDMGYQWYQQLVHIYGHGPLVERAGRKFAAKHLKSLKAFQWYIRKYVPEMIDMLKGMVAGAKDAGVSLSYEEVLAKWSLDAIAGETEFFQKITSRAYEQVSSEVSGIDAYAIPSDSENEPLPPEEDCSGFAAWGSTTRDGKLICGGNGDHQNILGINEINNFEYVVVVFPEQGNNFIFSTSTGCGWGCLGRC